MSVIRPKPPVDPIHFDPTALFAADIASRQAVERLSGRLEAVRDETVDHACAGLPERLLDAYGTRRPESELFAILRAARRIRDAVDRVVVLGSDPFVAGPQAIVEACCHPFHNELCRGERGGRPRLSFEGSDIDNDCTQGLLDLVAPHGRPRGDDLLDRWALLIVGGDDMPLPVAAATRLCVATLAEAVGGDVQRLAERVVPIGGCPADVAAALTDAFEIPAGLGPAQAVFSAVGLLPASIVGVDVVQLLEGAAAMNRRFREAPAAANPVLQWAAVAHCAEVESGLPAGGLTSRSRQLRGVGAWYDLLRPANRSRQGRGADRDSASMDLVVAECRRDRLVLPAAGMLAGGADPLAGLAGSTWPDLAAGAGRGRDRGALATISLPRIDEHAVGQLLQMLMLATAVGERLARP